MYGDFSRVLDGLSGRYSAVLAQQGRLLLDSELNEQSAILLDYLRRLTTDLVGPFGGPTRHCGFKVDPVFEDERCGSVRLSRGHYYVYGVRCEAPPPDRLVDEAFEVAEHEVPFVVYLVVWEQSVSAIQAPELIDPALGGEVPDTSRRSQVRWRPVAARGLPGSDRALTGLEPNELIRAFNEHNSDPHRRPRLGARAHATSDPSPGPDSGPTAGGYRGIENQLYRVEVHRGGDGDEATFKWSRDNGSVEFALQSLGELSDGTRDGMLRRGWYDERQALEVGDWVELVDDRWAPMGTAPPLMQVQSVSLATRTVTLADTDEHRDFDLRRHPLLRRWDQQPPGHAPNHGIPVKEADGTWFELEDGVQVHFQSPEAHYERGDFWLVPARAAIAGVMWPHSDEGPLALPPRGPARHLAPLAYVHQVQGTPVDLRVRFGLAPDEMIGSEPLDPASVEPETMVESPAPGAIASRAVNYRVRSVSSVESGRVYPVGDGTTIGRAAEAGIQFEHPDISRHHAQFHLSGATLTIADLGSTNGTFVNNRRLDQGQAVRLSPGDTVQIGSRDLQLQVEEA